MPRRFVTADQLRVSYVDGFSLNAELFSGEKFEKLEPRRLFPVSGEKDYISFLDGEAQEQFILVGMMHLPEEQIKLISDALEEYYRIPRITKILNVKRSPSMWSWDVITDRGPYIIEITEVVSGIKEYYDGRLLFRDRKDNRYEVPNYRDLDKHSLSLLHLIL